MELVRQLVQAHDDRDVFQASPGEAPAIDPVSLGRAQKSLDFGRAIAVFGCFAARLPAPPRLVGWSWGCSSAG
jgi:hypothetical protein